MKVSLEIQPWQEAPQVPNVYHLSNWIQPSLKIDTSLDFPSSQANKLLLNDKPVWAEFIEVKQPGQDHTSNEYGSNTQTQVTLIAYGAIAHGLNHHAVQRQSASTTEQSSWPQHPSQCLALTEGPLPEAAADLFKRIRDQGASQFYLNCLSLKSWKAQPCHNDSHLKKVQSWGVKKF